MKTSAHVNRWMIIGLLSCTFAITFWSFNPSPHTGGDNAGYLSLAHSIVSGSGYLELWDPNTPVHTKYPPVYPLVLALAMLLGVKSWFAFKTLSIVLTSVSVAILFDWIRLRHTVGLAVAVCSIVIFSPAILWSSNWILSEPLFLVLTVCCFWAFEQWEEKGGAWPWLLLGCLTAILAVFTRTAGLPVVLAVLIRLTLSKEWKVLAIFFPAVALPSLAWLSIAQGVNTGQYVSEFFLIDPYRPELGEIGVFDFFLRLKENASKYILLYFPQGMSGWNEGPSRYLGLAVFFAATVGWLKQLRRSIGVSELFLPAYFLLILSWPVVWSGDRFALPLYPLLLMYAGEGLIGIVESRPRSLRVTTYLSVVLLFLATSVSTWYESTKDVKICRRAISEAGVFACNGSGLQEFVSVADWLGKNLPDGSVVFTRKPRMFYVLSGIPSRTYPFTQDSKRFLEEAEQNGISYVVWDRIDRLGEAYVGSVVRASPEGFCSVGFVGNPPEYTAILGIRDNKRLVPNKSESSNGSEILEPCPSSFLKDGPIQRVDPYSANVPILMTP